MQLVMLNCACVLAAFEVIGAEIPAVCSAGHRALGKQTAHPAEECALQRWHVSELVRLHLVCINKPSVQTLEMQFKRSVGDKDCRKLLLSGFN